MSDMTKSDGQLNPDFLERIVNQRGLLTTTWVPRWDLATAALSGCLDLLSYVDPDALRDAGERSGYRIPDRLSRPRPGNAGLAGAAAKAKEDSASVSGVRIPPDPRTLAQAAKETLDKMSRGEFPMRKCPGPVTPETSPPEVTPGNGLLELARIAMELGYHVTMERSDKGWKIAFDAPAPR